MNPLSEFLVKRKMKKGGLQFSKGDVLKSRPVRNRLVKWETAENGNVSLVIPQ